MVTILVVEDNPDTREMIKFALKTENYNVFTASDGVEGLSMLKENLPDLIISDVMMPRMNGYKFYESVRDNPEYRFIPFVFLTAKGEKEDLRYGKQIGADDYLTKPFEVQDLLITVASKLKRLQEIRAASEKEIDVLKTEILNSLSHEFRTSVTLIKGFTETLLDGSLKISTNELQEFLLAIKSGSNRLEVLIENFLLSVDLETKESIDQFLKEEWEKDYFNDALDNVLKRLDEKKERKQVTIEKDINILNTDYWMIKRHLEQILEKLIDNAIKFSHENDKIKISCSIDNHSFTLHIQDWGIGIQDKEIPKVFDKFYQPNRSNLEQQGTGLGLAIVKEIVRIYNGQIHIDSKPEKGSVFTVTLPILSEPINKKI